MPASEFPAFLKIEHRPDGAARSAFLADLDGTLTEGKSRVDRYSGEITRTLSKSFSGFARQQFSIDLDTAGLRQAANDADFAAKRLALVRDTATELARSTGDTTQETHAYLVALRAQTVEAEKAKATADAQVTTYTRLQTALDATVAKNEALAASYRALYAEQANAENVSFRSQQAVNAGISPTLAGQRASDAGAPRDASYSAFNDPGYDRYASKALGGVRSDFGVDALLKGKASLDAAAASGVTLEAVLGRVSTKGQAVADALADAGKREESAARATATATKEAEQAQSRFAAEVEQVRQSIDPTRAAMQAFDAELDRAERAFAAGQIGADDFGIAVNNAANRFNGFTEGSRRATTSAGALRYASIQTGQQLQDIAVGLYAGQRAGTVFAQQLPQLAFVLTGLESSGNKTLSTIGKFATFMSGPWGIAIGIAGAAAIALGSKLFDMGNEVDDATKKLYDQAHASDIASAAQAAYDATSTGSIERTRKFTEALDKQLLSQRQINAQQVGNAAYNLSISQSKVPEAERNLATARTRLSQAENAARTPVIGDEGGAAALALIQAVESARKGVQDAAKALKDAKFTVALGERGLRDAKAVIARANLPGQADPKVAQRQGLQDKIDNAFADYQAGKISEAVRDAITVPVQKQIDALGRSASTSAGSATRGRDQGQFGSPLDGSYRISSGFGARERPTAGASTNHLAIDYAAPLGTPVLAAFDGIVKFANQVRGYGNEIALTHGGGTESRYAHLSKFAVSEGQQVNKGQVIGYVGQTGVATGAHLHYEVLVNGKKVDPSKGAFPVDPTKVAEAGEKSRQAAQKAADDVARYGQNAADIIAQINSQFDEQPKLIDQSASAVRRLEDLIANLPADTPGHDQIIADARRAEALAANTVNAAIARDAEASQRQLAIQDLLVQGKEREAALAEATFRAYDQFGKNILPQQLAQVRAIADEEYRRGEAVKKAQELQSAQLDAARSLRGNLESVFSGQGSLKDFKQTFKQLQGRVLTEQIFGDAFRQLDKQIMAQTGIPEATKGFTDGLTTGGTAATNFADVLSAAADRIGGTNATPISSGGLGDLGAQFDAAFARSNSAGLTSSALSFGNIAGISAAVPDYARLSAASTPANDNGDLVVKGTIGTPDSALNLTSANFFGLLKQTFKSGVTAPLTSLLGNTLGKGLSNTLSGALAGYAQAGPAGGILGGLGLSDGIGPLALASQANQLIGNIFGFKGGPLGVFTSTFDKIFNPIKRGSATLGGTGSTLSVTGTGGNNQAFIKAASGDATNAIANISKIADAFGATVDAAAGKVSIGIRDGKYRVDTTGSGITKTKKGAIDFGKDGEAAAVAYATADLIKDGVIKGLKAGTLTLLKSGTDLDAQLQKALDFEGVFTALKTIKDPVGAAIDGIDKSFQHLQAVFKEAGATTADYASLEELYAYQRAQAVKQAKAQITGSLQNLYDGLTTSDSLSLRDRETAARAAYDPLAARVKAGDTTAFDDFSTKASALLDIEKQLNGSQTAYFAVFDEIKTLTADALAKVNATADASAAKDSPFSTSTVPVTSNDAVVSAVNAQTTALTGAVTAQTSALSAQLAAMNANLVAIGRGGSASAAAVTTVRRFALAANF